MSRNDVPSAPTIRISGESSITTTPDVAKFVIVVRSSGETASDASRANAVKGTAVTSALAASGVPERAVRTNRVVLSPTYVHPQAKAGKPAEPPRVVGYQAATSIEVTLSDLTLIGTVIDDVIKAGADATDGLVFAVQDRAPHELAALTQAAASARARAAAIAAGLGVALGPIIDADGRTTNLDVREDRWRSANYASLAQTVRPELPTTPVSPGELTISASVTATFGIAA